ncbi:hypothetical protein OQA88_7844 [Cercophora sp. LCS_1]
MGSREMAKKGPSPGNHVDLALWFILALRYARIHCYGDLFEGRIFLNVPTAFSQFFTFAAFAVVAKLQGTASFSVTQAVTSLSILEVLMGPLAVLIYAIPQAYAALGCFHRIEEFLATDDWVDKRESSNNTRCRPTISENATGAQESYELTPVREPEETIITENASFGWNSSTPIVLNTSLRVSRNTKLTLILGPIGCGKSTLLKGLLGEALLLGGSVWVEAKRISFCGHNPWLTNGSIRDNIVGQCKFDEVFYSSVVHACNLDTDFESLNDGDATSVGSKGGSLSGGQKQRIAIARGLYARTRIAVFDDILTGLDAVTHEVLLQRVFGPTGMLRKLGTTAILATHATRYVAIADHVVLLDSHGRIAQQGPPAQLTLTQDNSYEAATDSEGGLKSRRNHVNSQPQSQSQALQEDPQRQVGDLSIYKYYFASLGWLGLFLFATAVTSDSVLWAVQYMWLTLWSRSNESSGNTDLGYWLGLSGLFGFLKSVSLIIAVYYLYVVIVPNSGQRLHLNILQAAMRAPLSFLSKTGTGNLINRFSQDMNLVDMALPAALINASFQLMGCLAVAALAIIAVKYSAATMPLLCISVYFLQRYYLRTSRQLRLLELEAKAPLYSHFLESLDGIASIRAYGWTVDYTKKSLKYLDTAQKPHYLLLCIQQWLTLVLGLIVAVFTTLLAILAVVLRGKVDPGFFGIALVTMSGFCETLASLINAWTSLETSLGAVSRVKTFSEDTPSEVRSGGVVDPPPEWPAKGDLVFENWSARYEGSPVLRDINLFIQAGEKIAVCGRTGSGKSSLLLSILGMIERTSGKITLDGLDLATIDRELVRKKVTCVTQEPFLFGSSVRLNIGPLGEATDDKIVAALEKVGLWTVIAKSTTNQQIHTETALDVVVDDKFLSHGQRQLFSLARALLRKSPLLLLDEPTSSVDATTESLIQDIVAAEFVGCSIIMVTHKLSRIMRFDKVAVLDKGVLVEYGRPAELLSKRDGAFTRLYAAQQIDG